MYGKGVSQMGRHIVLFEPEIPANTGNIARTCLATHTTLHLIHPLGFSTDDKMLRRAGLDYWQDVAVNHYDSIDQLFQKYTNGEYYFIENFGTKYYTEFDFSHDERQLFFIFGSESKGIPKQLIEGKEDRCLKIHMSDKVRSLNLANTAAVIIYEVLRQQNFPNMS